MNASINCSLHGAYKVELKSGNRIVETTEWFDNAITNTGLTYPFIYSFARSFMHLSLAGTAYGAGATGATGVSNPILTIPVYDYTFTGSPDQPNSTGYYNQSGQYIGWQAYEIGGPHNSTFNGTISSACGTKFTNQGLNLYRAWTIPTGANENGAIISSPLTINGFMVSPTEGKNSSGNCAFSIVDRTVVIPSGYTATITYQLSLNFANYQNFTYFSGIYGSANGYFNTGNAATGTNGSELSLLSGWSNLSGIYRQIIPGLQIVDALGACVIPNWGDQMEPMYAQCPSFFVYLTPDYSQFSVSQFGSSGISESGAYNSNGLSANYTQIASATLGDLDVHSNQESQFPSSPDSWYYSGNSLTAGTSSTVSVPTNTRLGFGQGGGGYLTSLANYSGSTTNGSPVTNFTYQSNGFVSPYISQIPVAYATPGSQGFDFVNNANYGQKAIYSTAMRRIPPNILSNSRSQTVTKSASFSPIQSAGTNTRYGSMTFAYLLQNGNVGSLIFNPYVDFLFFDTSGRGADMPHYRLIPDIYLTNRGGGVASVRFDITGANRLPVFNRLASAFGFMGPGVDNTNPQTPSGLDVINNPMINAIIPGTNPPVGSGYVFPGQILNTSTSQTIAGFTFNYPVAGNEFYNNGTGWGSVYGIVVNDEFYNFPIDTCLIDDHVWNGSNFIGFSGDNGTGTIPNPTGESSRIYWPVKGSGIGLKISDISYYLNGYGVITDPINYYSTGLRQMINDVIYTGYALTNTNATTIDLYQYTGGSNLIFFSGGPNDNFPLQVDDLTGITSGVTGLNLMFGLFNLAALTGLPIRTGLYNGYINGLNNCVQFSGFKFTTGNWGYYSNFTAAAITDASALSYGGGNVVNVGFTSTGRLVNMVYFDGSNYWPLTGTGAFALLPTNFSSPTGYIHHVENISTVNGPSGNRLLPNYAYPNNQGINYYYPIQGGAYPGMSTQNGMQVFFSFNWSGS